MVADNSKTYRHLLLCASDTDGAGGDWLSRLVQIVKEQTEWEAGIDEFIYFHLSVSSSILPRLVAQLVVVHGAICAH